MSGKANGGHARAAALSPERRTEIGRTAAAARWSGAAKELPPKCQPGGKVVVKLTVGQAEVLDRLVNTGLFKDRAAVVLYLIGKAA